MLVVVVRTNGSPPLVASDVGKEVREDLARPKPPADRVADLGANPVVSQEQDPSLVGDGLRRRLPGVVDERRESQGLRAREVV